ncbi:MAG: hypothetical protein IJ189_11890 [Clostridia bacterium]|nr:hypothetical protein [Clostridia bacterium]
MNRNADRDMDLKNAFGPTPDQCRDAVLRAVGTYKEDAPMKKRYPAALAIALLLALLAGAAYAIADYYSVKDAVAHGTPSKEFESHIVPLGETVHSGSLSITLGDAVFDGSRLAFTLTAAADKDAEPYFICPTATARCNGRELKVDWWPIEERGEVWTDGWGDLYPYLNRETPRQDTFILDGDVYDSVVDGPVEWTYTLAIYKPNWPYVDFGSAEDSLTDEELRQKYQDAIGQRQIGVAYGHSVINFANLLPVPEGMEPQAWPAVSRADRLTACGAFTLTDTITFSFTTDLPKSKTISPKNTFSTPDFDLTVDSLTISFMQVDFAFTAVYKEPIAHEYDIDDIYSPLAPDGTPMEFRSGGIWMEEDHRTVHFTGSVQYISDEPLTSITFHLDERFMTDKEKAKDEQYTFTVEVR